MSRATLQGKLAEIQITQFTKCSVWWHHHWAQTTLKGTTFFRWRINKLIAGTAWTYHTFRTTSISKRRLTTNKQNSTFCSTVQTFIWWPFLHDTFSSTKFLCLKSYGPSCTPTSCLNITVSHKLCWATCGDYIQQAAWPQVRTTSTCSCWWFFWMKLFLKMKYEKCIKMYEKNSSY